MLELESELAETRSTLSEIQQEAEARDTQLLRDAATALELQHELEVLRASFDATVRAKVSAEDNVAAMKEREEGLQIDLNKVTHTAQTLRDELESMVQ